MSKPEHEQNEEKPLSVTNREREALPSPVGGQRAGVKVVVTSPHLEQDPLNIWYLNAPEKWELLCHCPDVEAEIQRS